MDAFCSNCGAQLSEGIQFCPGCGKSLNPPTDANPTARTPETAAATTGSTKGGNALGKLLGIFVVLILMVGMIAMGSSLYSTHRAKKKANEIQQAYKLNDLAKIVGALGAQPRRSSSSGGGTASANAVPLSFPKWTPPTPGTDGQDSVPLRPGLTVVTAISMFGGDFESIKRIRSVTADSISLSYSADNPPNPFENLDKSKGPGTPKSSGTITGNRTVRTIDLRSAHEYMQFFGPIIPDVIPGTTAISLSSEILSDLKTKGETQLIFHAGGIEGAFGALVDGLGQMANSPDAPSEHGKDQSSLSKESCMLKRVDDGARAFPVLVNDQRVNLPAIHAQCETGTNLNDFYLLDDIANPLALAWKLGTGDTLQVVKISYLPGTDPASTERNEPATSESHGGAGGAGGTGGGGVSPNKIERQLEEKRQVEIYGIYFDFASDQIKPESEPVLKEISAALQHNPLWKLSVEGHTDNIGGDTFNLELSKHRAEAVKQALVGRYHIASDRLVPDGYGSSRPKESNDTLEGRARNRRVELIRQ